MRLFVALYPSPEAVNDVVEQMGRLRTGAAAASGINVRLTPPDRLHVTLAFLGDVEETWIPGLTRALDRAVQFWRRLMDAKAAAESPGPLRVRFGGGGYFGSGRFTVLWTGLVGDVDALHALNQAIRRELKRADFPYERRPFRPHLTIARPGDRMDPESIEEDCATLDGYLGPSWPVAEMVLMRSHLGPRPRYEPITAWPL
ncbi:MAG TPA: RNA 2',3'-cyclic phosphodiesterase [Micromonosporaceae bacterium]|nr:RNA 2',3'-cyclic phosphodiesterase [Micromonosporaceae bacterium]